MMVNITKSFPPLLNSYGNAMVTFISKADFLLKLNFWENNNPIHTDLLTLGYFLSSVPGTCSENIDILS